MDGTSRVTGDCHARFCERLGVKFPGPTRRWPETAIPTATVFWGFIHALQPDRSATEVPERRLQTCAVWGILALQNRVSKRSFGIIAT